MYLAAISEDESVEKELEEKGVRMKRNPSFVV
jgi:hypothetical protein